MQVKSTLRWSMRRASKTYKLRQLGYYLINYVAGTEADIFSGFDIDSSFGDSVP